MTIVSSVCCIEMKHCKNKVLHKSINTILIMCRAQIIILTTCVRQAGSCNSRKLTNDYAAVLNKFHVIKKQNQPQRGISNQACK